MRDGPELHLALLGEVVGPLERQLAGEHLVDAEHLRGMVKISADLSLDTSCPTLFRNINGVLSKLLRDWEEGPLTAERASQIDGRLRAPLMELVDGAINGANRDTLLALLDSLSSEVFLLNDPTLNEP